MRLVDALTAPTNPAMPARTMSASASSALALILLPALLLAGCAGDGDEVASTPPPPHPRTQRYVAPPAMRRVLPPSARVQSLPGLEGVIGAGETDLSRMFGAPRLTVWEGDARKLQFSGAACVLDVFLYPPTPGSEPRATYVDARRATDGQDVDRAACVAALRSPPRR